jgi:hypothetical protein
MDRVIYVLVILLTLLTSLFSVDEVLLRQSSSILVVNLFAGSFTISELLFYSILPYATFKVYNTNLILFGFILFFITFLFTSIDSLLNLDYIRRFLRAFSFYTIFIYMLRQSTKHNDRKAYLAIFYFLIIICIYNSTLLIIDEEYRDWKYLYVSSILLIFYYVSTTNIKKQFMLLFISLYTILFLQYKSVIVPMLLSLVSSLVIKKKYTHIILISVSLYTLYIFYSEFLLIRYLHSDTGDISGGRFAMWLEILSNSSYFLQFDLPTSGIEDSHNILISMIKWSGVVPAIYFYLLFNKTLYNALSFYYYKIPFFVFILIAEITSPFSESSSLFGALLSITWVSVNKINYSKH